MTMDEMSVAQVATEHPLATKVFARYGIDFCCGGNNILRQACEKKGLEPGAVVEEIRKESSSSSDRAERWDEAPLEDLVTHILAAYHRPLDKELPRLEAMARKVREVHRDKADKMLSDVLSVYLALKAELQDHMAKEEQILFPMILRGQGVMADGPIMVMYQEHDAAAAGLRRLRELTNGYEVPAEACNTWRALWHGLRALETSLHEHIHLENNILFPRALRR